MSIYMKLLERIVGLYFIFLIFARISMINFDKWVYMLPHIVFSCFYIVWGILKFEHLPLSSFREEFYKHVHNQLSLLHVLAGIAIAVVSMSGHLLVYFVPYAKVVCAVGFWSLLLIAIAEFILIRKRERKNDLLIKRSLLWLLYGAYFYLSPMTELISVWYRTSPRVIQLHRASQKEPNNEKLKQILFDEVRHICNDQKPC